MVGIEYANFTYNFTVMYSWILMPSADMELIFN